GTKQGGRAGWPRSGTWITKNNGPSWELWVRARNTACSCRSAAITNRKPTTSDSFTWRAPDTIRTRASRFGNEWNRRTPRNRRSFCPIIRRTALASNNSRTGCRTQGKNTTRVSSDSLVGLRSNFTPSNRGRVWKDRRRSDAVFRPERNSSRHDFVFVDLGGGHRCDLFLGIGRSALAADC